MPAGLSAEAPPPLEWAFRPRSVAVVGASNDPTRISGRAMVYLRDSGYAGAVYPINKRRDLVQGLRAYPSIAALPETPDIALIALPAEAQADVLRECAARGVPAAVVFAAGFAEMSEEGGRLQDELAAIAAAGGITLLGPNCLGILNTHTGFVGTFSTAFDEGLPHPGGVAIVSQSGAYGGHLAYLCKQRNIDVGYWIATGNEASTDVADCIHWFALQDDVTVILAYAEAIRDAGKLCAALDAAHRRGKPVVFMKVGNSTAGAAAAVSHTASMTGSDPVFDALLRQYGAYRVQTTQDQVDIAYACSREVFPQGRRLGIITVSGGFGVQLCDAAERHGLDVAGLPEPARERLRRLNPMASDNNPCDTTAGFVNEMGLITKTFDVMYADGGYDCIVGAFTMLPDSPTFGAEIREAIVKGTASFMDRPTVLCMEARPEIVRSYEQAGFLVFDDSERAVRALDALATLAEGFARDLGRHAADPAGLRALGRNPLSEHEGRELLAQFGIPFLPARLATSRDEAASAAGELGFPVALKIVSPGIPHKTEIGGVLLDVQEPGAVTDGYDLLVGRARASAPDARLDGVLVTTMGPRGVEAIVGVTRDAVFGPVVMVGLGGVQAEIYQDISLRVGAVTQDEALVMISEIRATSLLDGFRGTAKADRVALARVVSALSQFALDNEDQIESVELNPLVVLPEGQGVVALDVLIVLRAG